MSSGEHATITPSQTHRPTTRHTNDTYIVSTRPRAGDAPGATRDKVERVANVLSRASAAAAAAATAASAAAAPLNEPFPLLVLPLHLQWPYT